MFDAFFFDFRIIIAIYYDGNLEMMYIQTLFQYSDTILKYF